jgi:hypothetical protein
MKKIIFTFLILLAFIQLNAAASTVHTDYKDTLHLNGLNLEYLSEYATFWIDKNNNGSILAAANSLDKFEHWELYTSLNVGLNPHPLWLHLIVRNEAEDPTRYWWSLYSHADSVIVFRNGEQG